ncbi:hypothetical protein LJC54_01380 [Parabacteroides sp. OttesenSCG-928-J18]|nr:hypothetical protein [Parabacteroides sp. OttesenSCG-928-J18]
MKKSISILIVLLGFSLFSACDKEDFTQPVPTNWQVSESESFNTTMTAIVVLPDNLLKQAQDNDQMAAFMGEECRGKGELVKVGEQRFYFITIKGFSDEQGKIAFKYYNSGNSNMYATEAILTFEPDGDWGSLDNPKILDLKGVK